MRGVFGYGKDRAVMLGRGDEGRGKVIAAMVDWLNIRYEEELRAKKEPRTLEGVLSGLEADIAHSSLLFRLLEGKKALSKAPPRAFSYPAYELMEEDGPFQLIDVHFEPEPSERVLIEQAWWHVMGRPPKREGNDNPEWLVEWPGNGYEAFRLWQEKATGKWWLARAGSKGDGGEATA